MALDPAYVSQTSQYPDDSNVFHKRKPCFGWLSDDENSPERRDITKKNVQRVLNTGENAGGSRSIKSPRKVRFLDDIQMLESDDIKSRTYSDDMNSRIGRRHSDNMDSRMGRSHADNMDSRMGRSHSDDMNSRFGRMHSDDMNARMARTHFDERKIKKDRKHSWPPMEKYSSYLERASPCSLRAYRRRGPRIKDRNRVRNHCMQLLEQDIWIDVKSNFHEWHYRQDNQIHSKKDKTILYNRRYFADMSHEREEQRAIDKPLKSHMKSRGHVKEVAYLRNRDDVLSSFSRRKRIDNFQNLDGIRK